MKNIILLLTCVAFIGCKSELEISIESRNNAAHPVFIADTPRGKLFRIDIPHEGTRYHYIYYFDNSTNTVSVNYEERVGKVTVVKTIVIDGQTYELIKK